MTALTCAKCNRRFTPTIEEMRAAWRRARDRDTLTCSARTAARRTKWRLNGSSRLFALRLPGAPPVEAPPAVTHRRAPAARARSSICATGELSSFSRHRPAHHRPGGLRVGTLSPRKTGAAGRPDPDILTWGGGPLAGSRIPGSRRLVFCSYSPPGKASTSPASAAARM